MEKQVWDRKRVTRSEGKTSVGQKTRDKESGGNKCGTDRVENTTRSHGNPGVGQNYGNSGLGQTG